MSTPKGCLTFLTATIFRPVRACAPEAWIYVRGDACLGCLLVSLVFGRSVRKGLHVLGR